MNCFLRYAATLVTALFVMSVGVGCCSDTDTIQFKINSKLDPTVKDTNTQQWPPVQVHLVGVSSTEYDTWANLSMTKYWDPSNPHHDPMMYQPIFLQNGDTLTVDDKDPIWQKWKDGGVMYVFVMSSYPRASDDRVGGADSRRKIIPLQCKRWDPNPDSVTVTVKSDGVTFNPSPKPEQH